MSSPTSCGQSVFKSGGGKPIGYTYRSITLHFVPFILYLSYFTYSRHTDFDQEINILKPPTIYITNFIDQITRSPKKLFRKNVPSRRRDIRPTRNSRPHLRTCQFTTNGSSTVVQKNELGISNIHLGAETPDVSIEGFEIGMTVGS